LNLPPPPPPKGSNPPPPPPAAVSAPPPPPPKYRREPAVTWDAITAIANTKNVHPFFVIYSMMHAAPWHLGYLAWLFARGKECGPTRDMKDFLITFINTTPPDTTCR
jgi:hypothetical protein